MVISVNHRLFRYFGSSVIPVILVNRRTGDGASELVVVVVFPFS